MILIAEDIKRQLEPECIRCEISGSLRRKCSMIGDIEIVAIPKSYGVGAYRSGIATVVEKWKKVRGELPCKYTQRILPEGIKLDLFFANKKNWGFIFAIRTGSAEYSHKVLATGWVKAGYKGIKGMLHKEDKLIEVREEKDLFNLIGIDYVEPKDRELIQ